MSIRLTSRKTDDVSGLQLVPAIIIEEAWGAAQYINELVFGFVPVPVGRKRSWPKPDVVHSELCDPYSLGKACFVPPFISRVSIRYPR
jgi:hypothetical protein